jgi:uncharacterized membrane protein
MALIGVALQIPYATFFQLGLVAQGIVTFILVLLTWTMNREHPYYPLVRALAIILAVSMVLLVISYIAQATFMGWIS